MARIDNLENFLTDISTAIKEKKHYDEIRKLKAETFDEEILSIEGGDTQDATATAEDILYPKTAYTAYGKVTGRIQTVEEDVDNTSIFRELPYSINFTDIRLDLNLAVTISGTNIVFYKINSDGSYEQIYSISAGVRIDDVKIGKTPIIKNEEVCVYNIFCMINSGSWSNVYEGIRAYRYDVNENTLYSDSTHSQSIQHNANIAGAGVGYYPSLYTGRLICLDGTHCMVVMRSPGRISSSGDCNPQPRVYRADGTAMNYILNANQVCYESGRNTYAQHGIASVSGRLYMTVCSAGWQLCSFNESFNSYTKLAYSTSDSTEKPVMLENEYIYNNCVYDLNGEIEKEYEVSAWVKPSNYKFYHKGFIYEMDVSTQNVYKYMINDSYDIRPMGTLKGISVKSYSYGDFIVGFPLITGDYIYYYDSGSAVYRIAQSKPSGTLVTNIIRDGLNYQYLEGLTIEGGHQLLQGIIAAGNDGKIHGTMPNNGELNYAPSIESQTIPLGYTSGGTISPVTADIDSNIIPDNIKQGVEILGITGTYFPEGGDATSDANIQAKYLLEGYRAVGDGKWIEGEMVNYGTVTIERTSKIQEIPTGYYDSLTVPIAQAPNLDGYDECLDALEYINYGEPVSYTELNYIESTGTQYIDTLFNPNQDTTCECHIYKNTNDSCRIFGVWSTSYSSNTFSIGTDAMTNSYIGYDGQYDGSNNGMNIPAITNGEHTVGLYKNVYKLDDEVIKTYNYQNFQCTNSIYLFAQHSINTVEHFGAYRLYSCKIYDNEQLVREFIPVINNSNNKIGLYDKVNHKFYYNIGTGDFISGGVKE